MRAVLSAALAAALVGDAAAQVQDLSAAERRAVSTAGLNRASVVFARGGLVVALRERGRPSAGGGVIDGVLLQGEVVSDEAAQVFGYRSMRSVLKVDCVRRRDLVTRMTVYSEPGAKGLAIVRQVPGDWAQPSPGAYLASVNRAICGPAPRAAAAEEARPAPRPERDVGAAFEPRRAPDPPAAPRPAPARPNLDDPDAPMTTAIEAGYRPLPSETSSPAAKPALRPRLEPAPPAAAPARPPTARPARPGKVTAQIAASPTERQAREALTRVRGQLSSPLSTEVRKVVVGGKTYHRALVRGFQTRADAQAFCGRIRSECFVR